MTWNVVKRSANQNRVNCLFDVIGQSDTLSFFTEQRKKYVLRTQCTVRNEEDEKDEKLLSLGRSGESFVLRSSVRPVGTT